MTGQIVCDWVLDALHFAQPSQSIEAALLGRWMDQGCAAQSLQQV